MKRLFVLALTGLLALSAVTVTAGPAVEIPQSTFNFGRTSQHTVVSHTFWVKSVGDDTLRINRVIPGCGCTQTPLRDSVLAPGDSTRWDIFFSTKSYRGYVSKSPYLETNIGDEKTHVKIKAELLPKPDSAWPLVLSPVKLDVSQFTEKPRRKARFHVINRSDKDYSLTLVDWARDYFEVKLPGKVKAGETVEGQISVFEDKIPEGFEHSLTIQINDEVNTRYSLPIERKYRIKRKAAAASGS